MADAARHRSIVAADPGGEPICSLTAAQASRRTAPIDRLLVIGTFTAGEQGYEIQLPGGDDGWALAERFLEEESACCPSFEFEAVDEGTAVTIRASYGGSD